MTIQRQYSLPNCTLTLEGLGDVIALSSTEARPLLSVLINAECRLVGQEKPLSGGREFLDSLVRAVSRYAQELLSGFHGNQGTKTSQLVQFQQINDNTHRLSVRSQPSDGTMPQPAIEMDLNTVQLFDLVEAVDQLLADGQTLPDLTLDLKPLSRREIVKREPMAKQAIPAAIGVSSLAAVAIAMSLLPIPKVEKPKDLYPVRNATTATTGNSPSPSTSPTGSSPSPSPATNPGSPGPTTAASPDLQKLETALSTAPEITEPATLDRLGKQLQEEIQKSWTPESPPPQDLIYRVGVGEDGTILGYKPINPAALENAQKTPLLAMVSRQGSGAATSTENDPASKPLGQYKVVFTGSGNVEVAPWRQVMTSPVSGVTEITDAKQLETILPKLQNQINQNWSGNATISEDLIFKVRVKQDGSVIDYNPENEAAARYAQDTPLPKLGKPISDGNTAPTEEPVALFKVVFRAPDGASEISPWRGWQSE